MTKTEIWNQLVERYPDWKNGEHVIKQRAKGLKALLDQAYDNGIENGTKTANAINELKNMGKKKNPFDGLFGGGK